MTCVLLVEDDDMNREMMARRLKFNGFDVIMAGDGQEALTKATTETPDLVLMDMSLPVMDGWTATQQIRSHPAGKTLPIIALTAHALAEDREQALAAGCDDYDTKPVNLERLLSKMEALLKNRSGD